MKVDILGVKIDAINFKEALDKFSELLIKNKKSQVVKINAEFLVNAYKNPEFRAILNSADLSTADGTGVLWAAKFLNLKATKFPILRQIQIIYQTFYSLLSILFYPKFIKAIIPERVGGVELMIRMAEICAKENKLIFLFGGFGTGSITKEILEKKIPKIKIVGVCEEVVNEKTTPNIIKKINNSKAEILFIALGSPKQEFWIVQNLSKLELIKVAIGEGGTFDFIAQKVKRAPKLIQKLGLEWFWRFLMEPKRMIKRVFKSVPMFIYYVVKWKMKENIK